MSLCIAIANTRHANQHAGTQADIDDTIKQLIKLVYDLTNAMRNESALQPSQPLPSDFSHVEEWYDHLFDG